jgi:uncharacterized protein YdeI (YjbR/CyaY-like superfamily)
MKTLHVETLAQWRTWLAGHHKSASEVWLVFHKRHTGSVSIAYEDAIAEALCFGWVDSLIKRLDDERFARKFTPRKPDSKWSNTNVERYAKLKAGGRLMPAGLSRAPSGRTYNKPTLSATRVPRYIRNAFRKSPKAAVHFKNLAPSYRRQYIGWIISARQQETRMRRLQEAIRLLAARKKLGLK